MRESSLVPQPGRPEDNNEFDEEPDISCLEIFFYKDTDPY